MKIAAAVVATLLATATAAAAQAPPATAPATEATAPLPVPTADEIKRVTAYYLNGKDQGPVLLDLLLCSDVQKNAEGKLACTAELAGRAKKGEPFVAFVRFFAPRGGKYDLKVRFLLDGEVQSTSDFTVSESWTGYSNYKKTTPGKAGAWEAQLLQGDTVLASKKITVE